VARLPFLDWVRGFAVVAMVLWHTGDAWLDEASREGQGWLLLRFIGGLAAPGFLLLAGTGAALSAKPTSDPAARSRAFVKSAARGLEIVIIGYLLRYQAWMVDAGALRHLGMARAFVPMGLGYAGCVWAMRRLGSAPKQGLLALALGLAAVVAGMVQVEDMAPGRLPRLLQVDVLQSIGASLVLLAGLERAVSLLQRPLACLGLGLLVAAVTHLTWAAMPGDLPVPLAAYLGRFDAAAPDIPPPSLFPLLPWFAYACIGAAVGGLLRQAGPDSDRIAVLCSVAGAALAVITSEAHPELARLLWAHPELVHPTRVAFRVGVILSLFSVGWLWSSPTRGLLLRAYGQASLRIYWAHMLFAYGLFGIPLRRRLGYAEWAALAVLLLAAMWALTRARWPARSRGPAPAHSA
jgi:uncharacterized membrane protein